MEKTCRRCSEVKPAEDYYRDSGRHDGLHSYCKSCFRAGVRERYSANAVARSATGHDPTSVW